MNEPRWLDAPDPSFPLTGFIILRFLSGTPFHRGRRRQVMLGTSGHLPYWVRESSRN